MMLQEEGHTPHCAVTKGCGMSLQLRGGTLIDGTGRDPRSDASVTIDGERITDIGGAVKWKDGEIFDASGLTIVPGLIDAHVHFGWHNLDGQESPAVFAANIFRNCELALDAGFTTVRDVGGIDGGVVAAIARGMIRGPRILPSGPILCQTGGHGDLSSPHRCGTRAPNTPGLGVFSHAVDGPDAVRTASRQAFRRGATQLKLCLSGGVVSHTDRIEDTQFTVEEIRAAVLEAEARGTYVAAHTHHPAAIRNGLAAGVGSLEHCTYLDELTARSIKDAGVTMVPTLSVVHLAPQLWREWEIPEAVLPRFDGVEAAMVESAKLAFEIGVKVGSGSDLLGVEQNRRGLEIALKAQAIGAMEAIVSATRVNAELLRLSDEIGTVELGKRADLTLVDGDPLDEPELFDDPERVVVVIKGGVVVKGKGNLSKGLLGEGENSR